MSVRCRNRPGSGRTPGPEKEPMMGTSGMANMLKAAAAAIVALIALSMHTADAGEVVEVGIAQMKFVAQQIKITPGTMVKWVNQEKRTNHTVLFEQEGLESERLFPGESWQRTFDKPGIYTYRCGPHPEMTGVVEVAP